mgnify:CR=1 FL=1
MTLAIAFRAVQEDAPGPRWQALFDEAWPGYRAWYLRSGAAGLPTYTACRRALREHMPEMVPVWEQLVELAGGGDVEARFLSLWCPPAYIAGCSQAVWMPGTGTGAPVLLRNYDFAPALLEGNWLATRWGGRRVLAMGDCLWGVLDGMNEDGLVASLSFGGRTVTGTGFGIPLVMRYLLETARDVEGAAAILRRVPVHMTYNVTLLDRHGAWATVFVSPDRPVEVTRERAVTNFQQAVEWPEHARATRAPERLAALRASVQDATDVERAREALLQPPLFQSAWQRGYGTLYSAAYAPQDGSVELFWPGRSWRQSLGHFEEGQRTVDLVAVPP